MSINNLVHCLMMAYYQVLVKFKSWYGLAVWYIIAELQPTKERTLYPKGQAISYLLFPNLHESVINK